MANLEVAADELVRKLKSVEGEVEEVVSRFGTLKGQLETLGEQIDQDWIAVARAVGELVEKVAEEQGTLGGEAQETTGAVANLEGSGHSAQTAAEAGTDAAEAGTNQFAAAVQERAPLMDQAAQGGEQTFEALSHQAEEIQGQLDQTLQEAREFLTGDVVEALQTAQTEIADRFQEMRTTLTEECAGAMQNAYDEWSSRLDEVLQMVEEDGFGDAHEQGQAVVEWAMGECATGHEEEFERLLQVANVVQEALGSLQEGVGESETDVGEEGKNALESAMTETQAALLAMIGALDACRQVMSSYSFVQL